MHARAKANCIYSDWLTHQHRDTLASIVGHPTLTSYLAIADGESIGRTKFEMTEVRVLALSPIGLLAYSACSGCCSPADHHLAKTRIEKLEQVIITVHVT